ncbi:hypothetical protein SISSUDRAFT_1133317 [Sistotremastrum suecicum HHB10207 ss-3]|uniref:F-box domain-containing protein n=1 Tax=Sistotremastrum suecicum HHB10207 ss-3 TaxID=1314776 RepID=A0A165XGA7_9AGAM|nr:hypothetical protein SISSUDRAFT_1133317 [Sistotremastrum suecicum HHB10207 ss-3]
MPFESIPPELIALVIDFYEQDTLISEEESKERLKKTVALSQINRRFRREAIASRSLWTTIHLHWPTNHVNLFLERTRLPTQQHLSVYLDTRKASSQDLRKREKEWADFLSREMENIVSLDLAFFAERGSRVVSNALNDTPAPLLQSFTLCLDEAVSNNFGIVRLFDNHAPHLRVVRIYAGLPYDLSHFGGIREVTLRIGHNNFARLLEMLAGIPLAETITLNGVKDWHFERFPPAPFQPVALPACSTFTIRNVDASTAQFIFRNIHFTNLSNLSVYENMELVENSLMMSIFTVLPKLKPPTEPRTSLSLTFHPNRFVVEIAGLRYEVNWTKLYIHDFPRIVHILNRAISALETELPLHPTHLVIENSIVEQRRMKTSPLFLTLASLHVMLAHVFHVIPSVQTLDLKGSATAALRALCDPREKHLPKLRKINFPPASGQNMATVYDEKALKKFVGTRPAQLLLP